MTETSENKKDGRNPSKRKVIFPILLMVIIGLAGWGTVRAIQSMKISSLFNSGIEKAAEGDHPGAIEDFSRVIESDPEHAGAYWGRGSVEAKRGNLQKAIEDFTRSLELDPNAEVYFARGLIHAQKDVRDLAMKDYTKALELDPKYVDAWLNRGWIRHRLGDSDGAKADFTRTIEMSGERSPSRIALAYYYRGLVRYEGDLDMEGAFKDYDKAIEVDPKCTLAWVNRGYARLQNGEHQEAIADCTRALELNPPPEAYFAYWYRGEAFAKEKRYKEAVADLREAFRLCKKEGNRSIIERLLKNTLEKAE